MASFADKLVEGIMQPGATSSTVLMMNYSFFALFLSLGGLAFLTSGNIHVLFLLFVSIGLCGSINWFVAELAKVPAESRQVQQMPDPNATSTDVAAPAAESSSSTTADDSKKDQ
ncbi:unnamed protein product [Tilletia laevis]|uniref:Uncharacterized protein n=2 Tax=Tilletia TaxID=13289 RepID=A0A8X7SSE4_9BASI|nr:hypothetical protein CF336_g8507 [Tilletia laevis]KAE8183411.1 hypothetical protein CF328_g8193 [Tilletia controversa]KAE8242452.1 hypothetical protein A4X03_0g8031 [Tilletia caries]KAE8183968.1 hypothetical protein CF335_g8161 [Tilletia laevis]KAE8238334.1 hypothetical protein A4X06_0g8852 [Tilletia controversa]